MTQTRAGGGAVVVSSTQRMRLRCRARQAMCWPLSTHKCSTNPIHHNVNNKLLLLSADCQCLTWIDMGGPGQHSRRYAGCDHSVRWRHHSCAALLLHSIFPKYRLCRSGGKQQRVVPTGHIYYSSGAAKHDQAYSIAPHKAN